MLACGQREAMVMAPPPMHDLVVWPCFPGFLAILHRHFPPQSPESLNSSSQPLHLPRNPDSCLAYVWLWQGLILIPFRLPQICSFTLSLKCFSSDLDNCPTEIIPLLQFPQPPRPGPVLLTLLFFPLVPLSYQVLHGSIYSFPLVRSSCLL